MKRNSVILSFVAAVALLLSGCNIIFEPAPQPRTPDDSVRAVNDTENPVGTYTIPAGGDLLVRINPSTNRPVLYIELDRNFDLEVFDATRRLIASSSSPAFFARGAAGLTSAVAIEAQALNPLAQCRGSCVILDQGTSSEYFALITNTSGSSLSVELYAFGDTMVDLGEPENDVAETAPVLDMDNGDEGAIEVLGDQDYWRVTGNATFIFDAPSTSIDILLEVYSGNEVVDSATDGETFEVFNGEIIVVRATNNRAGASSESAYYISPAN